MRTVATDLLGALIVAGLLWVYCGPQGARRRRTTARAVRAVGRPTVVATGWFGRLVAWLLMPPLGLLLSWRRRSRKRAARRQAAAERRHRELIDSLNRPRPR
jgi:hypothetical protein